MRYSLITCMFWICGSVLGQKPVLSEDALLHWRRVGEEMIGADGKYAGCVVSDLRSDRRLVVASTQGAWRKEIPGTSEGTFAGSGDYFLYKKGADSLFLMGCGGDSVRFLGCVTGFEVGRSRSAQWIAYAETGFGRRVTVLELSSGRMQHYDAVEQYLFDNDNGRLLMKQRPATGEDMAERLCLVGLRDGNVQRLWAGKGNERMVTAAFSQDGTKLAFLVERQEPNGESLELWLGRVGDSATLLVGRQVRGYPDMQVANGRLFFNEDASMVFFPLQNRAATNGVSAASGLDIWSYLDPELQPVQVEEKAYVRPFTAVVDLASKRVLRIEHEHEVLAGNGGGYALLRHELGYEGLFESNWNAQARFVYSLLSLRTGEKKVVRDGVVNPSDGVGLSPTGKWWLYYDHSKRSYWVGNVHSEDKHALTAAIPDKWTDPDDDLPEKKLNWEPWLGSWLADDEAVFINSAYDIWEIDPKLQHAAVNFTNGYGAKHHIRFQLIDGGKTLRRWHLNDRPVLYLRAFDTKTKRMGFYRKRLGEPGDPELCTMGSFWYGNPGDGAKSISPPLKAEEAEMYVVLRQSATAAPNYFVTADFSHFRALTDLQPQEKVNWLTDSLVHWRMFDGMYSMGILYKPENFDLTKKYPIIFDYYERRSDELNVFIVPGLATDRINIAWFVSRGYLVFVPDIIYGNQAAGKGAYNSVVSAAKFFSGFSWVDAKRMGIQGHSFGGYETNYLVTHTTFFAAACSASGFSDLLSWYGSAARGAFPMYWSQRGQGRLVGTPWQRPDLYIGQSPVWSADKVVTPLLMMNNKSDDIVPFAQGVELFMALRRLGRRVWMLQYDGYGHSVAERAAWDYTRRLDQFFDHYLKGAPAPVWMTSPLPVDQQGIGVGFEMDSLRRVPPAGLSGPTPPADTR
jgi:dipeptidyl aminopeptidase/acylaminoacyl peptidase